MGWYDEQKHAWLEKYDRNTQQHECVPIGINVNMGVEYRFVPVFKKVAPAPLQPGGEYGLCRLSHSRPVPGGFSGRIEFDLVAETPVLFGRKQTICGKEVTTHARLYEDGPFAAPGRAIRGMIRNVLGIATFSHFSPINGDHRFFSRNMDYLAAFAKDRQGSKPQVGWLRPVIQDGELKWHVCVSDFGKAKTINSNSFLQQLKDKYCKNIPSSWKWNDNLTLEKKHAKLGRKKAHVSAIAGDDFYLVTAGTMSRRKRETLFPRPPDDDQFKPVNGTALAAFLFANSEYKQKGAEYPMGGKRSPRGNFELFLAEYLNFKNDEDAKKIATALGLAWKDVEKLAKRKDEPPGIPVYCWGDPKTETFEMGTSQMVPKGPAGNVQEFLVPKTQEPLEQGIMDWADALFGMAAEEKGEHSDGWQGRLSFDFALANSAKEACVDNEAYKVLQGQPKASFDPFYLKKMDACVEKPASWADKSNAMLSGYKRYPACREVDLPKPEDLSNVSLNKVESLVRPLKKGAIYKAAIDFHNLHPLELGALLWAISFGDPAVFNEDGKTSYRHVAGRLRNKGLGRLRPANVKLLAPIQNPMPDELQWNQLCPDEKTLALTLLRAFEVHMGQFVADAPDLPENEARQAFYCTGTITALLNTADANWQGEKNPSGNPIHDKEKMFKLSGTDADFKSFSNLRKLHYKKFFDSPDCSGTKKYILPGSNKATILDEFLTPKCGAANVSDEEGASDTVDAPDDLVIFMEPAAMLEKWRTGHEK